MANRSCVIRLSRYKNALRRLQSLNFVRVYSDNLGDLAGVTAAQVRKDFSVFGITGNRRGGYNVSDLVEQLNAILGKDKVEEVVVVGCGNIGKALIGYSGFEKSGIKAVAGFDIDPEKHDREAGVPILPLGEMVEFIKDRQVRLGVVCVPDYAAQQVMELMLGAGVRGILNFAPMCLKVPEGCFVSNINLETEFENLIYFVNAADGSGD